MLDRHLRPIIDPTLNALGAVIARWGVGANTVSLIGLGLGLLAMGAILLQAFLLAIGLILASRLADGLDGAVARHNGISDFGGYLDILCDYAFYAAIPLAFVLLDPAQNGKAGVFLLASFYINAGSFLGFAILAEKRQMQSDAHGTKSVYFTSGLLEGTETIMFFVLLCLIPNSFAALAFGFGALCLATALFRVVLAARVFKP